MPALGTAIQPAQIAKMYPTIPPALFREHDWRDGTVAVGTVPAADVRELTGGAINRPWTATLNALVARGGHDLVLSMGQVVPHEALGMANYTKNLFIGVAGAETINFTHHIMAVYGVENVMGRASNPGRALFDRAFDAFCPELPALFAMTVVGTKPDGARVTRGFYVGDTSESFKAARLSLEVNFTMVDEPHAKAVPARRAKYAFTWTANKAIYRTRPGADGGELVARARRELRRARDARPADRKCERATSARASARARGPKPDPDARDDAPPPPPPNFARRHGYRSSAETMSLLETDPSSRKTSSPPRTRSGKSEGRFKITLSVEAGGGLSADIEKANFEWGDVDALQQRYDPAKLTPGATCSPTAGACFLVPQPLPAGLWASKSRPRSLRTVDPGMPPPRRARAHTRAAAVYIARRGGHRGNGRRVVDVKRQRAACSTGGVHGRCHWPRP